MTTKQLLIELMGTGLPKGEIKQEMFAFYNSKVGTSKYFVKKENSRTGCGQKDDSRIKRKIQSRNASQKITRSYSAVRIHFVLAC